MIGIPYIKELFTSILAQSSAIEGRFHICPKGGHEINTDTVGELIQDLVIPASGKKYPMSIMMPPSIMGNDADTKGGWEKYIVSMFFLKTTHITSLNKVSAPNLSTNTSTHAVYMDWHDMHRAAVNFMRVLHKVVRNTTGMVMYFRMEAKDRFITPVSKVGIDSASGVKLDFSFSIFNGCEEQEDYPDDYLNHIVLPSATDSHPEHDM